MKHIFWIIALLHIQKTHSVGCARREWWSIPLPHWRSPTDDFSSLLLSLRFTRQREDSRFCSFPQRGRRGVKKKTAGDGHSNSLQRFFWHPRLSVGQPFLFDANILLFPVVGKRYPNFFIYGVERPLSR